MATKKTTKSAKKAKPKAAKAAKAKPKPAPKPKTKTPKAQASLPSAADVDALWRAIEAAWEDAGEAANAQRAALAARDPEDEADASLVDEAIEGVVDRLREHLEGLDAPALAALDRALERKLYDIDRSEIQAFTDGSDDGFLYARGYIVILGRAFYEAVDATPAKAIMDAEYEEVCYLPAHVYEKRFGKWPTSGSGISRETGANASGWADG